MASHPIAPTLVWYIDDDAQTSRDIIAYWKNSVSRTASPFEFRHFSTARAAWEALRTGNEVPRAVIVDGHLNSDEGEFTEGAHFVRLVRSGLGASQPLLLAFSGDEFSLNEMERAGADASFAKANVGPVLDYLVGSVAAGPDSKSSIDSNPARKSK